MINFGLLGNQQNAFNNALGMGMQIGQDARQRREKEAYVNALQAYDPSNPDSIRDVMKYNPELGLEMQKDAREQRAAAKQADVQRRASQGDPDAMLELAGIDVNAWNTLDKAEKARVGLLQEQRGNAALDALRSGNPRATVEAYAQNSGDNEAAALLELPDEQLVAALRSEVSQAGMITELLNREDPEWKVIPQGGVIADVNDPATVSALQGGAAQGGGQFQEGQTATNPQTGRRIVYRNGAWRPLNGAQ